METNIREYSEIVRERFSERTVKYATLETGLDLFNSVNYSVTSRYPVGTNVFSEDWDLAVVLDACRADFVDAVADEYDFISDPGSIWSVGSMSHEWTTQTFSREYRAEIDGTAFLSANPFSHRTLVDGDTPPYSTVLPFGSFAWRPVASDDFAYFEQISADGTDFSNTVPPWKMTDRLVSVGRSDDYSRVVAHYFQPHRPFLAPTESPMEESEMTYDRPMELYDRGEISDDELWDAQIDSLRAVLDCIEVLLDNFDAEKVVVTADHGQLLGEFGVTGHPGGLYLPQVKRVPWIETTATDEGTYMSRADGSRTAEVTEERLKHLGDS
jgi:hypothetical protein